MFHIHFASKMLLIRILILYVPNVLSSPKLTLYKKGSSRPLVIDGTDCPFGIVWNSSPTFACVCVKGLWAFYDNLCKGPPKVVGTRELKCIFMNQTIAKAHLLSSPGGISHYQSVSVMDGDHEVIGRLEMDSTPEIIKIPSKGKKIQFLISGGSNSTSWGLQEAGIPGNKCFGVNDSSSSTIKQFCSYSYTPTSETTLIMNCNNSLDSVRIPPETCTSYVTSHSSQCSKLWEAAGPEIHESLIPRITKAKKGKGRYIARFTFPSSMSTPTPTTFTKATTIISNTKAAVGLISTSTPKSSMLSPFLETHNRADESASRGRTVERRKLKPVSSIISSLNASALVQPLPENVTDSKFPQFPHENVTDSKFPQFPHENGTDSKFPQFPHENGTGSKFPLKSPHENKTESKFSNENKNKTDDSTFLHENKTESKFPNENKTDLKFPNENKTESKFPNENKTDSELPEFHLLLNLFSSEINSQIWNFMTSQALEILNLTIPKIETPLTPALKLLKMSKQIMQKACPHHYVPPGHFDLALQTFINLQKTNFDSYDAFLEYAAQQRIEHSLNLCLQNIEIYPFVDPDPMKHGNATHCNEAVDLGTFEKHGEKIHLNVSTESWGRDREPLIETVWKIFTHTHRACFKYFEELGFNDHHRFTFWMVPLFANGINDIWNGMPVGGLFSDPYSSLLGDLEKLMEAVTYCSEYPKLDSALPWEIPRPEKYLNTERIRRKRKSPGGGLGGGVCLKSGFDNQCPAKKQ